MCEITDFFCFLRKNSQEEEERQEWKEECEFPFSFKCCHDLSFHHILGLIGRLHLFAQFFEELATDSKPEKADEVVVKEPQGKQVMLFH